MGHFPGDRTGDRTWGQIVRLGVRSAYSYGPPLMSGRRLTAAMCAGGRSLAEPRLSPDGSRVAFVDRVGAVARLVVVPAAGGPE
ncbi:MAG: hypothetical protein ACRD1K_05975, partial [Acidimicrobiales bacterium]